MYIHKEILVPSPSRKSFSELSLLFPLRLQFDEIILLLIFNPPSILQSDIIIEFFIPTSEVIIVLSPILALGPIVTSFPILQFFPMIHGEIMEFSDSIIVDSPTSNFSLVEF